MAAPTGFKVTAKVTAIVVEKCDDYGCPFNHDDLFCMAAKKRFFEMSYLRPSAERMVDDLPDDCPLLSKPVLVRRAVEGAERNQRADGSWPGPGGESRAAGPEYEVERTTHYLTAEVEAEMKRRLEAGWKCEALHGWQGSVRWECEVWWSRPKCAAKGSVGKG